MLDLTFPIAIRSASLASCLCLLSSESAFNCAALICASVLDFPAK